MFKLQFKESRSPEGVYYGWNVFEVVGHEEVIVIRYWKRERSFSIVNLKGIAYPTIRDAVGELNRFNLELSRTRVQVKKLPRSDHSIRLGRKLLTSDRTNQRKAQLKSMRKLSR